MPNHDKLIDYVFTPAAIPDDLEYLEVSEYMINDKFSDLFGGEPRKSESEITQRECDIAASIQTVTEDIVFKICKNAKEITGQKNLSKLN